MHNSCVIYPPSRIRSPRAYTCTTRRLQNDIFIHSWQHKMSTYFPLSRQILEMKMNKENDHLWEFWSYNFKLSFNTNCVIWDFFLKHFCKSANFQTAIQSCGNSEISYRTSKLTYDAPQLTVGIIFAVE